MIDYAQRLGIKPTGKNESPAQMIDWFDDLGSGNEEYRFLSNFYEVEGGVTIALSTSFADWPEHTFPTTEHAFAAAKADNEKDFLAIAGATGTSWDGEDGLVEVSSPNVAKSLGRSCSLEPYWEQDKIDVMRQCLDAKFSYATPGTTEMAERLLATGQALLVEGTWWHDVVWGVDLRKKGTPGRNLLGVLLMARRAELQAMKNLVVASIP